MNQMAAELEYRGRMAEEYDHIDLGSMEDIMMGRPYQYGKRQADYRTPSEYWQQEIQLQK